MPKYLITMLSALLYLGMCAPPFVQADTGQSNTQSLYEEQSQKEQQAIEKTKQLLADKLKLRRDEQKKRIRTIYKLSRSSFPKIWFESSERVNTTRWLGIAKKIAKRDKAEIKLLLEEIEWANHAKQANKNRASYPEEKSVQRPAPRSLQRPVSSKDVQGEFGEYPGQSKKVRLRRRGIYLKSTPGERVRSPAAGRVRYTGPIAGLGLTLIVDHDSFFSVIGQLKELQVKRGEEIKGAQEIAISASTSIYLEIRLATPGLGTAIDPQPLLK